MTDADLFEPAELDAAPPEDDEFPPPVPWPVIEDEQAV